MPRPESEILDAPVIGFLSCESGSMPNDYGSRY